MSVKLKYFTHKLSDIFFKNKKSTTIFVVGIVGILLIGLSDGIFDGKTESKKNSNTDISVAEYINDLEIKTEKIISKIEGAGKCKIMITADSSKENKYAVNENKSQDISGQNSTLEQSTQIQNEIVIIEQNNDDSALVVKVVEPKIRGVLVLCGGANESKISEEITNAIKTVLGVPYNKICVLKLK